ncbi:MAG: two-component system sensor kinase FixL [Bermanella sp.]|jgi:two-component system sensor kinase FixL
MHRAPSSLNDASDVEFDQKTLSAIQSSPSIALYTVGHSSLITGWNLGAEKLYGFQSDDIIGEHCATLCPESAMNTLNKNFAKLKRGRVVPEIETQGRRKNGGASDVLFSMHPISTDISANKAAEQTLVERAYQIKAVVETVPDAIITIDSSGIIEAVNPSVKIIFGYSPHEVLGCNVSILMPLPYREEHNHYLENYLSTQKAKGIGIGREVTGLRKNGEHFPMELAVNMVFIGGRETFIGAVKDISERKRNEDTLNQQFDKIEPVNRELKKNARPTSAYAI